MATKLKDYVRTYTNVLSKSVCDTIIKNFDESDSIYTDREQRPTFRELNISQRYHAKDPKWVAEQNLLIDIFDECTDNYIKELDLGPDFPARYSYEEFRMKMYENNNYDQFKDHVDVQDHASARRFLVGFLYLNDVEEGGETNFKYLNLKIKPERGLAVFWNNLYSFGWPNYKTMHEAMPPIKGKKYILTKWYRAWSLI